jgi:DNA-binding NarL/FixJ family response regulator
MEIRVAIVDRNILFREGLSALFERQGGLRVVLQAGDVDEFSETIRGLPEKHWPHSAILDMTSLQKCGGRITRNLYRTYPNLHLMVVNVPDNPIPKRCLARIDAHSYFLQGCSAQEITETLYGLRQKRTDLEARILDESTDFIKNDHNLSRREMEVMRYLCQEYTTKEIASKLFISEKTVGHHREKIQKKIGAVSTVGIVLYAVRNNMI